MIKFFKVEGNSLYPYLKDGERILCFKVFAFSKIKIDDIVVFSKPPHGLMIKQVKRIKDSHYFVQGTDPMSIDSRDFGMINRSEIKYKKVTFQTYLSVQIDKKQNIK